MVMGFRTTAAVLPVAVVVMVPLLSHCNEEDEEDETLASQLVGTWTGACVAQDTESDSISLYSIIQYVFDESTVAVNVTNYTDSACTAPQFRVRINYSYTLGAEVAAPAGATALDVTAVSAFQTTLSETYTTNYNSSSVCGVTDWQLNVEKDVTTLGDCALDVGSQSFDVVQITNGSTLQFGETDDANDGSTAELRPQSIAAAAYTKAS